MRIRQLREFCENKDLAGQGFDSISMRPVIYGKAGLDVGIPAEALLYVCTLHWPIETRHEANIKDFDLAEVNPESGDGSHILLGYVKKLAEARIPIMAVGPAGTGKSYLASQLAYDLGFEYGECPMTAGASPTWLLGSHTAEGFKSRPFIEIYENGGVFNFEELDASDPNMLLVANNALESDRLFNPISGKEIVKHNEFIPYATANTFGLGSNRAYTGRERLDFATLDRFRMGRVVLGIDTNLEDQIFNKVNDAA